MHSTRIATWLLPLLFVVQSSADAQVEGTCASPMHVDFDGGVGEIHLDTRNFTNLENTAECGDTLATGPDVVLDFRGGFVAGVVTWEADFPAVLYLRSPRSPTCDAPCVEVSTGGSLKFNSGYWWEGLPPDDHPVGNYVYLIVDGLNGAAGLITLHFDYTYHTPTHVNSWGRIKSNYR